MVLRADVMKLHSAMASLQQEQRRLQDDLPPRVTSMQVWLGHAGTVAAGGRGGGGWQMHASTSAFG